MKYNMLKYALLLAVTIATLTTACRKEEIKNDAQSVAQDITAHNDLIELITADADASVNGLTEDGADDRNDCPVVSTAQPRGTWPNTITLDYSDAGCTKNGHTYQGKIIINQTGPINAAGTVRTLTFENFFFEGVKVEGTKTVTNQGTNAAGQPFFAVNVQQTLTYPDGDQATYTSERVRTMLEGAATEARIDDVWQITGNASGTNRNGVAYTVTITTPLIKRNPCAWVSEGIIEFVTDNATRSLDFGDGTCDRDATLTRADGTTREVKIKHRWWRF
jgi:hypothetical protein